MNVYQRIHLNSLYVVNVRWSTHQTTPVNANLTSQYEYEFGASKAEGPQGWSLFFCIFIGQYNLRHSFTYSCVQCMFKIEISAPKLLERLEML